MATTPPPFTPAAPAGISAGTLGASAAPAHVYLFATCLLDLFAPQAGLDAIELIERLGVRVRFPEGQTCCGQPAYTSGFPVDARAVAAAQLDLFPEPWPIVVPSGSCAGMIRHHWPRLFADDPLRSAQVAALAARTVEFTDFLAGLLGEDWQAPDAAPETLCLHTSCSARREMGTHRVGRQLLARLPGVTLAVHDHESECCGFGGTFSVKQPDISAAMAADKADAILATGCDGFVSADCGCLMNLNLTLEKRGAAIRGEHIASFLLRRLAAGEGSTR